jgi:hypothetical protein
MKLEVGMYVRTKCGLIAKIQSVNEYKIALINTCCERQEDKYFMFPNEGKIYEIVKSSSNIIDLIEEGDYVNGYLVVGIEKDNFGELYVQVGHIANNQYQDVYVDNTIDLQDIKEVLTKEQYNANIYKL